jgi:hypothetical protein
MHRHNLPALQTRHVRQKGAFIPEKPRAASLIAELREKAPIAHMIYWVEPVSQSGRMMRDLSPPLP